MLVVALHRAFEDVSRCVDLQILIRKRQCTRHRIARLEDKHRNIRRTARIEGIHAEGHVAGKAATQETLADRDARNVATACGCDGIVNVLFGCGLERGCRIADERQITGHRIAALAHFCRVQVIHILLRRGTECAGRVRVQDQRAGHGIACFQDIPAIAVCLVETYGHVSGSSSAGQAGPDVHSRDVPSTTTARRPGGDATGAEAEDWSGDFPVFSGPAQSDFHCFKIPVYVCL